VNSSKKQLLVGYWLYEAIILAILLYGANV